MKSITIYLIVLIFIFKSIYSFAKESNPESNFMIGFNFGIGMSSVGEFYFPNKSSIDGIYSSYGPTFNLGFNVEYLFKPKLKFYSELSFINLGGGYKSENPNVLVISSNGANSGTNDYLIKLWYFQIPLLCKLNIGKSMYLSGGTGLSILINSKFETNDWVVKNTYGNGYGSATSVSNSVDIEANNFDVPLICAIGFEKYNISKTSKYGAEIRGTFGTIPLFPVGNNTSSRITLAINLMFK